MATQPADEEIRTEGNGMIAALPVILRQRRWFIIVPLILATIGGVATAFLMHRTYESSATVLIESQQVPDNLIGMLSGNQTPESDVIDERVARARERVLSRQELIRLIRTYGLYQREQQTMPLSKIIDKMRNATTIESVDNLISIGGPARRAMGSNSIAITVAFDYDDPIKAQLVAQQFVDHFLEADASTQASQASDTVNFLTEQANGIQAQMAQLEQRATQIRAQNGSVLALSGVSMGGGSADYSQIDSQIAALQAQNAHLQSDKTAPDQDPGVAQAEQQLRVVQARFSDTHPDVIAAKAQLEAAKRVAATRPTANPIASQIAANRAQIASLENARGSIASHSSSFQAAASRAPALASQLDQLEKAADVLRDQYRAIGTKLQAAQIQARMESEQKGERLTLADPPVVPDRPIRPNRPLIIAGAIAAGLAAGLALVMLVELILRPIRGTAGVRAAIGAPPLAIIPDFDQRPSRLARWMERRTRRKSSKAVRA